MKEENLGNNLKLRSTSSEYKKKIEDAINQFDEMESQFKLFKENSNDQLQDFSPYETCDTVISTPYTTRRAWWIENEGKDC